MSRTSTFTVFFEGPFWVGVLERCDEAGYWVGRHVFGAELRRFLSDDLAFLPMHHADGQPLSFAVSGDNGRLPNAKRAIREARRQQEQGLADYAHVALQAAHQQAAAARKAHSRQDREDRAEWQFRLKQAKAREKHRGH